MAFVTEKEELKPGLILFRRGDVKHGMWYCRLKIAGADRYKTISLKTEDAAVARTRALEHETDIGLRMKYGIAVFTPSFREIARQYLGVQQARAQRGEITGSRAGKVRAVLEGALDRYLGATQVHLIDEGSWGGYPAWRRETGMGRNRRNGVREVSDDLAVAFAHEEAERRAKARHAMGFPVRKRLVVRTSEERMIPFISDSTIRFEMAIFRAVLRYAEKKGYVSSGAQFERQPKLKTLRRDAFTAAECQHLQSTAQGWIAEAVTSTSLWHRTVAFHMIQIACDTGMRPGEMKNLRWRDVEFARDRDGRDLVVLSVHGKEKFRRLVAPKSVGTMLEDVRRLSKATEPNDRIFTNGKGEPAKTLYSALVADLLKRADLRDSTHGIPRSTYCFRHTYATLRLEAGVDVYLLAQQMGTSVPMIERHYGHVDIVKHADRLLNGMSADPLEEG
jgi:integrase